MPVINNAATVPDITAAELDLKTEAFVHDLVSSIESDVDLKGHFNFDPAAKQVLGQEFRKFMLKRHSVVPA